MAQSHDDQTSTGAPARSWLTRPAPTWLVLLHVVGLYLGLAVMGLALLLGRADGDPCDPEVPQPAAQKTAQAGEHR